MPAARLAQQPFCFDPIAARLIAPWPRHSLWPDEEATLCAVIDQLTTYGAALRVVCWIWPDPTRAPEPVQNLDPRWLARWSEGRACYRQVAR